MKYLSRLLYWILSKLPEPQGKVGTLVEDSWTFPVEHQPAKKTVKKTTTKPAVKKPAVKNVAAKKAATKKKKAS